MMRDRKRNSMRKAQDFAADIVADGATRGLTPADLFGAFAQIVANQNPRLARLSMEALEATVRAHVPMVASGPAMRIEDGPRAVS